MNNQIVENLLEKSSPIEVVVRLLAQISNMFNVDHSNNPLELKERVVNGMFKYLLSSMSPEEQLAQIEYVNEKGVEKREDIILESGEKISEMIKIIALNTKQYLKGDGIDHYLAYQCLFDYACDFSEEFIKL
ncbi:MAG: hypothetical protein ACRCXZ_07050 [Patescibacteria group bacterium]